MENAADEGKIGLLEKDEKFKAREEVVDMRYVLNSSQGRRVIWRYLTSAGVFESSFTGNSTTFFNEGKRSVGLRLLADIMEANPDSYIQMMKESKEKN